MPVFVVAVVPPTFLFQFAVKHQIDKLNKYIKLLFNIQLSYICDYDDVAFSHIDNPKPNSSQ